MIRTITMLLALAPGLASAAPATGEDAKDPHAAEVRRLDERSGPLGKSGFLVEGRVSKVAPGRLVVRREGLPDAALRVTEATKVRLDRDAVALDRLEEGQEVRVRFDLAEATPLAIEVQAVTTDDRGLYRGGDRIRPPPQDWSVPYEGTDPASPRADPPEEKPPLGAGEGAPTAPSGRE